MKLDRSKIWSLEDYAAKRAAFRAEVIEHKKVRRVALGAHATLVFEDFTTMKYQVQEMLRVERIFEADAIADEIASYNPLIPDGDNWKATFMIEYEDVAERRDALSRLIGVEHRVWVKVADQAATFAVANEDLPRSNDEKTAAVHFLRFELTEDMALALKYGVSLAMGIDHPRYQALIDAVPATTK